MNKYVGLACALTLSACVSISDVGSLGSNDYLAQVKSSSQSGGEEWNRSAARSFCQSQGKQSSLLATDINISNGFAAPPTYSLEFSCEEIPSNDAPVDITLSPRHLGLVYVPHPSFKGLEYHNKIVALGYDADRLFLTLDLGKNVEPRLVSTYKHDADELARENDNEQNNFTSSIRKDDQEMLRAVTEGLNTADIFLEMNKTKVMQSDMRTSAQKSEMLQTLRRDHPELVNASVPGASLANVIVCSQRSKSVKDFHIDVDDQGVHITAKFRGQIFATDLVDLGSNLTPVSARLGAAEAENAEGSSHLDYAVFSTLVEGRFNPSGSDNGPLFTDVCSQ